MIEAAPRTPKTAITWSVSTMKALAAAMMNMIPEVVQPTARMIVATRRSRMQSIHAMTSPPIESLPASGNDRTSSPASGVQRSQIKRFGAGFPGRAGLCTLGALLVLSGCASVPGETLAPASVRRDVSAKILARAAQAKPECRRVRIVDTEVLEVHADGKVAAERWSVERCDERVNYRVSFPPTGNRGAVQVHSE